MLHFWYDLWWIAALPRNLVCKTKPSVLFSLVWTSFKISTERKYLFILYSTEFARWRFYVSLKAFQKHWNISLSQNRVGSNFPRISKLGLVMNKFQRNLQLLVSLKSLRHVAHLIKQLRHQSKALSVYFFNRESTKCSNC